MLRTVLVRPVARDLALLLLRVFLTCQHSLPSNVRVGRSAPPRARAHAHPIN